MRNPPDLYMIAVAGGLSLMMVAMTLYFMSFGPQGRGATIRFILIAMFSFFSVLMISAGMVGQLILRPRAVDVGEELVFYWRHRKPTSLPLGSIVWLLIDPKAPKAFRTKWTGGLVGYKSSRGIPVSYDIIKAIELSYINRFGCAPPQRQSGMGPSSSCGQPVPGIGRGGAQGGNGAGQQYFNLEPNKKIILLSLVLSMFLDLVAVAAWFVRPIAAVAFLIMALSWVPFIMGLFREYLKKPARVVIGIDGITFILRSGRQIAIDYQEIKRIDVNPSTLTNAIDRGEVRLYVRRGFVPYILRPEVARAIRDKYAATYGTLP